MILTSHGIFITMWPYVQFHQDHTKVEKNVGLATGMSDFKYKS